VSGAGTRFRRRIKFRVAWGGARIELPEQETGAISSCLVSGACAVPSFRCSSTSAIVSFEFARAWAGGLSKGTNEYEERGREEYMLVNGRGCTWVARWPERENLEGVHQPTLSVPNCSSSVALRWRVVIVCISYAQYWLSPRFIRGPPHPVLTNVFGGRCPMGCGVDLRRVGWHRLGEGVCDPAEDWLEVFRRLGTSTSQLIPHSLGDATPTHSSVPKHSRACFLFLLIFSPNTVFHLLYAFESSPESQYSCTARLSAGSS
jgi:hypothetical protein